MKKLLYNSTYNEHCIKLGQLFCFVESFFNCKLYINNINSMELYDVSIIINKIIDIINN